MENTEQNSHDFKPVHYLMMVTGAFFLFVLIATKRKLNVDHFWLWPFIRIGTKWCIFSWFAYGGFYLGKKSAHHKEIMFLEKIKELNAAITRVEQKYEATKDRLESSKKKHEEEIRRIKFDQERLEEKLTKFNRSASEVNRDALKNFL